MSARDTKCTHSVRKKTAPLFIGFTMKHVRLARGERIGLALLDITV